jgi:hypothetical protein
MRVETTFAFMQPPSKSAPGMYDDMGDDIMARMLQNEDDAFLNDSALANALQFDSDNELVGEGGAGGSAPKAAPQPAAAGAARKWAVPGTRAQFLR